MSTNMTFLQCCSFLMDCFSAESVSSVHFTTQLKAVTPTQCSRQDERGSSRHCLSCTHTKQQILALEFHESLFCTVAHDIAGTQLTFPLALHRAVTLHPASQQMTCDVTATSLTDTNRTSPSMHPPCCPHP